MTITTDEAGTAEDAPTPPVRPPRRTAADAAHELLAAGEHVHLVSDGAPRCLNHTCGANPLLQGLT